MKAGNSLPSPPRIPLLSWLAWGTLALVAGACNGDAEAGNSEPDAASYVDASRDAALNIGQGDVAPESSRDAGGDFAQESSRGDGGASDSALDRGTDASSGAESDATADADAGAPGESLHFYGRWNVLSAGDGATRATTVNAGSHVTATFHGSSIAATFDVSHNIEDNLPNVTWRIDDGDWKETDIAPTLAIADGLSEGPHTLLLMARGFDEMQNRWKSPPEGAITFTGLVVEKGNVDPSLRPPQKKIEFLGDSITEGVHIHDDAPGGRRAWNADGRLAYPAMFGLAQKVAWRQVGFGRIGLTVVGNGNVPVAIDAFPFMYEGVPRDAWQPDIVVINLGTNDAFANVAQSPFTDAYAAYLNKVRSAYPDALLCLLRPFHGEYLDAIREAAKRTGEAKILVVDTGDWLGPGDYSNDHVHPNAAGSAKAAARLAEALRSYL